MERPPPIHIEVTITVHPEVLERYKAPSYADTLDASIYPLRHTEGTGALSGSQMKLLEGQLADVGDFLMKMTAMLTTSNDSGATSAFLEAPKSVIAEVLLECQSQLC